MRFLKLQAFSMLIECDRYLRRDDFAGLYCKVRNHPCGQTSSNGAVETICGAVDMACIWYWKEVLCLQRSAATTCLLKQHGVRAQMVLGTQQKPFAAHAWVEVDGVVVNDKPYMREMYAVLDQC